MAMHEEHGRSQDWSAVPGAGIRSRRWLKARPQHWTVATRMERKLGDPDRIVMIRQETHSSLPRHLHVGQRPCDPDSSRSTNSHSAYCCSPLLRFCDPNGARRPGIYTIRRRTVRPRLLCRRAQKSKSTAAAVTRHPLLPQSSTNYPPSSLSQPCATSRVNRCVNDGLASW